MRQSGTFIPTLKESPADAEVASHRLLVRGGFMRRVASGIYDFLPLGVVVIGKIMAIIREEMSAAGAQEVLLPILQPRELWEESGRWSRYGDEMMRFSDRAGREFGLGPTHEEIITDLVRNNTSSYRDLPLNLYQIGPKFRDEMRPRFGLLRGREFLMKDGYSFDRDEESMLVSYQKMYEAYGKIFSRCGCTWRAVEADTGLIGGDVSHEFMVPAEIGEAQIAYCRSCDYAANIERAEYARSVPGGPRPDLEPEKVHTPDKRTIQAVSEFLDSAPERFIKCLIYLVEDKPVAVLVPGDREVNETKLGRALGTDIFRLFAEEDWPRYPALLQGFVGPVGLAGVEILAEASLEDAADLVCGANVADHHLLHVGPGRDFKPARYEDLASAREGDACPRCLKGRLHLEAGIEVGQVFQLKTKYSLPLKALYRDEAGESLPMVMGTYGIGVSRLMAAIVEQRHDERGINWPAAVAPAHLHVLPLDWGREEVRAEAETLYREARELGIQVLLDDRDERAGVKFADAGLIGIPWRAVIGKEFLASGNLELQPRGGESEQLGRRALLEKVREMIVAEITPKQYT